MKEGKSLEITMKQEEDDREDVDTWGRKNYENIREKGNLVEFTFMAQKKSALRMGSTGKRCGVGGHTNAQSQNTPVLKVGTHF